MDAETSPEGSGRTTDEEDVDVLNTLNAEFRQSKAEQIFRFLQDQEELNQKFEEYALNSEEDNDSEGSVGEAESRLSHQLDLHRVRPANRPQAAWSDLAALGDDASSEDAPPNEPRPDPCDFRGLTDTDVPRDPPALQVVIKNKRKGSSRSSDNNASKTKRTLSKVATRPQTAVGLRSIDELGPSSPTPSPLPKNLNVTTSLMDGRLALENYDGSVRQPFQRIGMMIRNPAQFASVTRKGRVKQELFGANGESLNQLYGETTENFIDNNRLYGSEQSSPVYYQNARRKQRSRDPLERNHRPPRVHVGASNFADLSTGNFHSSGRIRLTDRPDAGRKLITLEVDQPVRTINKGHNQERQFEVSLRHSANSGRASAEMYRNNATMQSNNGGRVLRTPALANISGMEPGARNMTVLKLPPLENNVTSTNLPSNSIINTPNQATLNPTHVAH